jgi:hypothetical protein
MKIHYPNTRPADVIEWARSLKVNGHHFDPEMTPQLIEPIRAMVDEDTRIGTFVKPVQVGGSTAGEIVLAYWAAFMNGLIQFNWQDDEMASKRWHDRIFPTLESCRDIHRSGHRFEEVVCTARYSNATVRVQGVFMESALDSDTVPYQINEEVHLWKPGFLSKARRRQTRVWNAKAFDISNAGTVGDQLYSAYEDGTCERWEVLCPKCKAYHEMRFRFNPNKPELGGLRWDSAGCKMENRRFNYNKLERTIRYEFPCGNVVRDFASERRILKGDYSAPKNEGAHISHRSWNFEAVSCDAIKWLTLIQEWHAAIRALRVGDKEPMRRFVTERECRFYDDDSVPFSGRVEITSGTVMNRKGLDNAVGKIWSADWQQGFKHLGELTHYWLVIESVLGTCSSQVMFADKVADEGELLTVLKQHGIVAADGGGIFDGFVDASKNTKHILSFCYRNFVNAVIGGDAGQKGFRWPDGSTRYYSEKKYIYKELQMAPKFEMTYDRNRRTGEVHYIEDHAEPFILRYNKAGLLKNHFFIREMKANVLAANPQATPEEYIERIVPADIGDDYLKHHEAWERDLDARALKKMGEVEGFKQVHRVDHLMSCSTYIDMMKDWSGLLGNALARLGIERKIITTQTMP